MKKDQQEKPLKFPMQPVRDFRFVPNRIVQYVFENSSVDLNDIACADIFTNEEHMQFAQLIGYSVSGFGSLSYVDSETYQVADILASHQGQMSSLEARNQALREILQEVREGLKVIVPAMTRIHPDDLEEEV